MPERKPGKRIERKKKPEKSLLELGLVGDLAEQEASVLKKKLKKPAEKYVDVYTYITDRAVYEEILNEEL